MNKPYQYRLMRQNGRWVGPKFYRYVDAFNYRLIHNLVDARIWGFALTRAEAIKRLTARYNEQAKKFPRLREDVPLDVYIKRNIRAVRVFGQLADYA